MSELRIAEVTLEELLVLVVTKEGDPGEAARAAFSELEAALPSLRGRRLYGYYEPNARRYFACVVARNDDRLALERRTLPGGAYARVRLSGQPPELYERIGETFDGVARSVAVDASRPWPSTTGAKTRWTYSSPSWHLRTRRDAATHVFCCFENERAAAGMATALEAIDEGSVVVVAVLLLGNETETVNASPGVPQGNPRGRPEGRIPLRKPEPPVGSRYAPYGQADPFARVAGALRIGRPRWRSMKSAWAAIRRVLGRTSLSCRGA